MPTVPFCFDADFYRKHYADLSHMTTEQAAAHFLEYGIDEGRQGSALGCREAFVDHIRTLGSVLEIGPFCAPTLRGENIRYLDVLNADQLRVRADELGLDRNGCPKTIHYLGDVSDVHDVFDAVVSSHSIEHHPDLIHHLEGIANILRPGEGRYFLLIPDKRYCFDHYLSVSTIADVVQANLDRPTVHSLRSVIEHRALTTHNDPSAHWSGNHGDDPATYWAGDRSGQLSLSQTRRLRDAIVSYEESDAYIDVHAWYFTPASFWTIMSGLHASGMIKLRPVAVYPTLRNTLEFFAVLERD